MSSFRWVEKSNRWVYASSEDEIMTSFVYYPFNDITWGNRAFLTVEACKKAIEKHFQSNTLTDIPGY